VTPSPTTRASSPSQEKTAPLGEEEEVAHEVQTVGAEAVAKPIVEERQQEARTGVVEPLPGAGAAAAPILQLTQLMELKPWKANSFIFLKTLVSKRLYKDPVFVKNLL
jgi:hypothetical protein